MNRQMTKTVTKTVTEPENCRRPIRAYRIEFGSDDYLYSVSFKAAAAGLQIHRMLDAARGRLYKNLQESVQSCLEAGCTEYSDFTSNAARLEHDTVMASAARLLHGSSCDSMDRLAGGADEYYSIMDHQRRMNENCGEGCYYAVSRTISGQNGLSEYRVIGQTFQYDIRSGREQSFFAIRKNEGSRQLHTLEHAAGCPVLSPFGCVDMAGLLMNIRSVTTKEQAARIANR